MMDGTLRTVGQNKSLLPYVASIKYFIAILHLIITVMEKIVLKMKKIDTKKWVYCCDMPDPVAYMSLELICRRM